MTSTLETRGAGVVDTRPVTLQATEQTPTALWNDSADPHELATAISEYGAVGATCNPVIAYTCIQQDPEVWVPRIRQLAEEHPTAGESALGWMAVEEPLGQRRRAAAAGVRGVGRPQRSALDADRSASASRP